MVIANLADLCRWVQDTPRDVLAGYEPDLASRAVEDIAGVIHRHAHGQQLSWGDDWGWVLELYGPDQIREIATESVKIHGKRSRRT